MLGKTVSFAFSVSDAGIQPRVPWWRLVSMSGFGSVFSIELPGDSVAFLWLLRVLLDVKVEKLLCGIISFFCQMWIPSVQFFLC